MARLTGESDDKKMQCLATVNNCIQTAASLSYSTV